MKRPGLPNGWQKGLTKSKIARIREIERTPYSRLPRLPGDHPKGYERVYLCLKHPYANSGGWQFAHRFMVMRKLGRVLDTYEHVHHVNGDKADNRLSNLDIVEDVDHGHYHYGQRLGCGREFRSHSFVGRPLEVDGDGTPTPYYKRENQNG